MITFYIMNTDLVLVQDKVSIVSPQCSDIIVQMAFVLWLLIWLKTNENQTITHLVLVYNVILNGMISNFLKPHSCTCIFSTQLKNSLLCKGLNTCQMHCFTTVLVTNCNLLLNSACITGKI